MWGFALVGVALLLSGCPTYQARVTTPESRTEGAVRIEFVREKAFPAGGLASGVFDQGQIFDEGKPLPNSTNEPVRVGNIVSDSSIRWDRAPGECSIRTSFSRDLKEPPRGPGVATFVAFPGTFYRFKLQFTGGIIGSFSVVPADPETEQRYWAGRKIVQHSEEDRSMANGARFQEFSQRWIEAKATLTAGLTFAEVDKKLRLTELMPGTAAKARTLLEGTQTLFNLGGQKAQTSIELPGVGRLLFGSDGILVTATDL